MTEGRSVMGKTETLKALVKDTLDLLIEEDQLHNPGRQYDVRWSGSNNTIGRLLLRARALDIISSEYYEQYYLRFPDHSYFM